MRTRNGSPFRFESQSGLNPQHRANTGLELARDPPDTFRLRQRYLDCRKLGCIAVLQCRPSERHAFGLGARNARQYALTDDGAFELGKDAHHLKHRPAAWGRRI